VVLFSLIAQPTTAQELTLGVSAIEFSDRGQGGAALVLEYRHRPFYEGRIVSVAFGANGTATGQGDAFIGAGVWTRWGAGFQFDNGSAVSASIFHMSNASLGDTNPGADGFLIRYHHGF